MSIAQVSSRKIKVRKLSFNVLEIFKENDVCLIGFFVPLSIIDDTVIFDYLIFKDISCQKHLITFSSFSLPSFSLHLEDICHVCRPVFECAYKVYEIKTGRPCSTQWFKEHQEEIYSFLHLHGNLHFPLITQLDDDSR